jgi:hypothetical protein
LSDKQAINLTSMNIIEDELMTTISEASTHLETFINERDNHKVLEDCISSLQQIRGSLDLIQLHGACELAGEILSTAMAINIDKNIALDEKLSALTKGFFILSCYFEYTQQHQSGMPVLLVPYINDLRLVNRQAVMPESYFETSVSEYRCPPSVIDSVPDSSEDIHVMLRRFRHMYQLGLLGVIKEQNVAHALTLMQRACNKIYRFAKGCESETLWWLVSNALQAFTDANIAPSVARKRLLSHIDKQLRLLEKQGESAFDQKPPESLLIELAYYVALAADCSDGYAKIKQLYGFTTLIYTEQTLQQETAALTGPNASTVESVAEVLRVELNVAKENMEKSQTTGYAVEDGYTDTISRMQRVKDILHVVGLTSAANVIRGSLTILASADEAKQRLDDEGSIKVVDAFLYVESVLSSLAKRNFSGEQLNEMNQLNQNEMISSNNLIDAQLVVMEEAERGITQIKQSLTAFTDSEYDTAHIGNFSEQLQEIRGGMTVLGLPRAAAIVAACHEFIEKTLMSTDEHAALEYMLETFADALICLEYYLGCMKVDKQVSADNLVIAEESLAALGYPVKVS